MLTETGARLSTTSEGLWLTAALAGVTRLPPALKIRPMGDTAELRQHPGMAAMESAGVWRGGALDAEVEGWVVALARADVELTVTVRAGIGDRSRLVGPPPVFTAPRDPLEAYAALEQWHSRQPAQRVAVLSRHEGQWVCAARVWETPAVGQQDAVDEVVVSPISGTGSVGAAVYGLLGPAEPAVFDAAAIEASVLNAVVSQWQSDRDVNVAARLVDAGLSIEQARVVEAVGDATTTRAVVSATQHHRGGAVMSGAVVVAADTALGRVVVSTGAAGAEAWTVLGAGTEARVVESVEAVLTALPSGQSWRDHRRSASRQ